MTKGSTSKTIALRLNPSEYGLLKSIEDQLPPALFNGWIEEDQDQRGEYRNAGRKPSCTSILLRRAIQIGLSSIQSEVEDYNSVNQSLSSASSKKEGHK
jgi:hypothetical protein